MIQQRQVNYKIGFDVSKNDLTNLQKQLTDITVAAKTANVGGHLSNELKTASVAAEKLRDILDSAWNSKLGQLNLEKVNSEIKRTWGSVEKLKTALVQGGKQGAEAFGFFSSTISNSNIQLKETNKLLDRFAVTFKNTVRYGFASSIFNNLSNSIQKAYNYTKNLDSSLNDIRIVVNKSAEDMDHFAVQANNAAKALGKSTLDYTKASTIYYQQGLSDEDVATRAEVTLKAANVTGQTGEEVSELLTSVWNGYKVTADEAELYVDKLAAVAASTASDLEELSTGMSKVASAANLMGVDVDQLNAQLATIVSVTRQAPESVGTALKTIYARMGDIEAGVDTETTLGTYTQQMADMGVNVLDANGELRDMGEVIEEIGNKWKTLSREQQVALSQTMAGTRQYNNLLSLFDNWNMYTEAIETSKNSAGELQRQQDIYMESTEAHLQKLRAEAEKTYATIFDQETARGFIDLMNGALSALNSYLVGLGGGMQTLTTLGLQAANIFSSQISSEISRHVENKKRQQSNKKGDELRSDILSSWDAKTEDQLSSERKVRLDYETEVAEKIQNVKAMLNQEEIQNLQVLQQQAGALIEQEESYKKIREYVTQTAKLDATGNWSEELGGKISEKQDSIKSLTEQINARKTINTLKTKSKKLTEEESQKLADAKKILGSNKATRSQLVNQRQAEQKELDKLLALDKERNSLTEEQIEDIHRQSFETQKLVDDTLNIKAQEKEINAIIKSTTLTLSTLTSFQGILATLGNKDLSAWEKFSSILSVVAVQAFQFYRNGQSVTEVITNLTKGVNTLNTKLSTNIKNIGTTITSNKKLATSQTEVGTSSKKAGAGMVVAAKGTKTMSTASKSAAAATKGLIGSLGSLLATLGPIVAIAGAVGLAIYGVAKALNADAEASQKAHENAAQLKEAYEGVKTAYDNLHTSLNQYSKAKIALNSLHKETEEWKQSVYELNEQVLELINNYPKLAQYISSEDGVLTIDPKGYEDFLDYQQQMALTSQTAMLQAQKSANQVDYNNALDRLYADIGGSNILSEENFDKIISKINENPALLTSINEMTKAVKTTTNMPEEFDTSEAIAKSLMDNSGKINEFRQDTNEYLSNINGYTEAIKTNLLARSGYSGPYGEEVKEDLAKVYDDTYNEWVYKLENRVGYSQLDVREEYAKLRSEVENTDITSEGFGVIRTFTGKGVYTVTDETGESQKVKVADEEAIKYIANYYAQKTVDSMDTSIAEGVDKKYERYENYSKNLAKIIYEANQGEDLTQLYSKEELQKFVDILKKRDEDEEKYLTNKTDELGNVSLLSPEFSWSIPDSAINYISDSINNALTSEELREKLLNQLNVKSLNTNFDNLITSSIDGTLTPENVIENADYNKIITQLETLQRIYPELDTQIETFNDTTLVGTTQWKDALYDLEIAVSNIDIDKVLNDFNKSARELDSNRFWEHGIQIDIDDTQFQQQMDDLLDKDYSVSVTVEGQLTNEFKQAYDGITDITSALQNVEEGWLVSRENIVALGQAIPGIADNYKIAADNMIQLDETTAKSAIEAAKIRINASREETIKDLEYSADLYHNKAESYHLMAEAAMKASRGEIESAEAVSTINAQLDEIAVTNSDLKAINEQENSSDTVTVGVENAQTLMNVNKDWASNAIENAKKVAFAIGAAMKGDLGSLRGIVATSGTAKGEGAQVRTVQEDEIDVEKSKVAAAKSNEDWERLAAKYTSMENLMLELESQATTQAAALRASTIELEDWKPGAGKRKSGSSKDADYMKALEDELDIYHDVNVELDLISNQLDILDKQKDKLFGKDLINNINQQLKLLDRQIETTNEKIKIAQGEAKDLQSDLSKSGVKFNTDGTISNYSEVYEAQLAYVQSLINKYNSMGAEAQEKYKNTVEQAEANFETFTSNIERYDELITDFIPELESDIQDAVDEQIDLKIESFNLEIEVRLNMAEAERDWNEFKKRVIDGIDDDDILGNARARLKDFSSYYNAAGTAQVQALTEQVNNLLGQLRQQDNANWASAYGDNRTQSLEDLKEYYTQLMESLEDVLDLQEEIHQAYIDMIDEATDKFGEQVEMYETVRDLIEHDMNVIELVYGEEAYGSLSKYYDRQEENYNKQLEFQRMQKDFWYAQMQTMEEGTEEWAAAKENWLDAVDEWNSAVEDAIENLQDKYLNAINEIFQKLNNEVTAGKGLDYTNQEWELINKNAEQYLDTVDATWGIQKLENKYLDAYDQTDSISARRQIKKIMDEELALLREQDKLTQYDIDRANKRYDIMLKQIALQEAQQNKSSMRLRRDSQGNYSYQFVADDSQIGQLQDELGDLYNSLYNFDKEKYQENLNNLYDMWIEFQEAMTEAAQINDPVERAERELLIREQYEPLLNGILQENLDIRNNLTESAFDDLEYLYQEDADHFKAMTDMEKDAFLNDLIPAWTSGIQQMADAMTAKGGFLATVQDSLNQIDQATNEYENGLLKLQETAGQSFGEILNGIDKNIDETEKLIQNNQELVNTYKDALVSMRNIIDQLNVMISKYKDAEKAAKDAATAAKNYWIDANNKAANKYSDNTDNTIKKPDNSNNKIDNNNNDNNNISTTSNTQGGKGDGVLNVGDTATFTGRYYYDSYGSNPSGSKYSGVINGIKIDMINKNPYGIHIRSADGKYKNLGWIRKSQLSGFDTGGYTGEWGNTEGRLALLHQKELVLNSTDTQNILNAVNIMRTISGAMLDKLSAATANSNTGVFDGALEQNVHIEANFPNVQNSHEIEDAIDNLMNRASQRINYKG